MRGELPCLLFLQCEAPKKSNLVYNSNVTMVYGTQTTTVTGAFVNQLITGEPHIVPINNMANIIIHSLRLVKHVYY